MVQSPGKELGSFFKKKKNTLTLGSSSYTPRHLSQRNKNLCLHKNLYTNVYSTFICKSQKLAVSKMSLEHMCHGAQLSTKEEQTTDAWSSLNETSRENAE